MLFDRATVWIGAKEIEWAAAQPPGFDPLPELYVQALATDPRVKRVHEGEEFLPGIAAFMRRATRRARWSSTLRPMKCL